MEEWLPIVYEIAGPLLQSARMNEEPPTVVGHTQDTISWLARAVLKLDEDSPAAPSALANILPRLITVRVFANAARERLDPAAE
jgi:hypothetical protein